MILNEKVWSQLPLNLWLEERKALQQQHEQMITPGVHLDRPAIGVGYPSAYVVSDLLSEGLEIAGRVIDPPSDIVQSELEFLRSKNSNDETNWIRAYVNRFLEVVSLDIPLVDKNDVTVTNWNFLSKEELKPKTFKLPAFYLAYSVFEDDALTSPAL